MKKHLFALIISAALLITGCDVYRHDQSLPTSNSEETSEEISSSEESKEPRLVITGPNEVLIGEKIILTMAGKPDGLAIKSKKWKSSNSLIASVYASNGGGRVTGKKAGKVTITATATIDDGSGTILSATYEVNVVAPEATSITLSKASYNVRANRTKKLNPTILPKDADQTVTWKSSKTNIATVSSDGVITPTGTLGKTEITATTVNGLSTTCEINVVEPSDKDAYTIMVYICGANLESDDGLASKDIEEMRSVEDQPDEVNIIFETGGATAWKRNIIKGNGANKVTAGELGRYHIEDNDFIQDGSVTYQSMGASSTLQSFLTWGFTNYPAEKYGLILWNHGGAMNGCCYDETENNDCLTADEVDLAVSNARTAKNITDKLEFITYDACLMAVQDIAEVNSHNFNYMLSSQESEGGYGYDYDAWLPLLYEDADVDTVELLSLIGDTFLEEEKKYYNDQTQSAYDLSKMPAYYNAFEAFAQKASTVVTSSSEWSTFKSAIYGAKKYGGDGGIYSFDVYDVKGAMENVKDNYSSLSNETQAVIDAIDDLVVYENHHKGTSGCGINLFCPIYGRADGTPKATYQKQTNFTNWYSLVSTYGSWASGSWY